MKWHFPAYVLLAAFSLMAAAAEARTGILVVAKDRGEVGNRELSATVADLDPDLPVELLLIGPDRQGIENGYADYISAARAGLLEAGAESILAIPLFVSDEDHLLGLFRERIESAMQPLPLRWAAPMEKSYLAREILIDRIREASRSPHEERLLLLMSGAGDRESAAAMQAAGERLLAGIHPRLHLADSGVAVVFSETAPDEDAEAAWRAAGEKLQQLADAGPTLLVPFAIDVKFTPYMSFEATLARRLGRQGVRIAQGIMPHPAVRTWLRRTINAHLPASDETIGIVIMPHGSSAPYNDGIVAAMPDLLDDYPSAFAFGMASRHTIAEAVAALEEAGVRHAVFLRLFSMPHSFRDASDYLLGLRATPPGHGHGGASDPLRTPIRFISTGGYQADPLISGVLKDRILEASVNPAGESVLLLSHGSASDEANAAGLAVVARNIADIEATLEVPFREIRAIGLREDWPDKREAALAEIRAFIERANRTGRAIVVSNRLYGSGSYAKYLEGLDYVMAGQGLIPHPDFTRWVEKTLERAISDLKRDNDGARVDSAAVAR